ncbi:hypothetical protein [Maribacter sp. 2-571]|uniref:hypothetical protein n=1 Tax=Maribacter sp. 2-571 TaxID=3417569 RepID=UPI003D335B35
MNYPNLLRLEDEIKALLAYRLTAYRYKHITVEAYYAMNETVMCRIEIFSTDITIANRIAKYEAQVKEGFYQEAERNLIAKMKLKAIKEAI